MITVILDEVGQGNSLLPITINFWNDDGSEADMSGAEVFMQFKYGSPSGVIVGDFAVGSGLAWDNILTGKLKSIQIDELDWGIGTYFYDVRVKETGFPLYTLGGGTMDVVEIITKRKA